jgi:hypothetical protein
MTYIAYHGTERQIVEQRLMPGKIDRKQGGGELGQGFYLGKWLFVAQAWAWNDCKRKPGRPTPGVLKVKLAGDRFRKLLYCRLGMNSGHSLWFCLRQQHRKRTFVLGVDLITSPILGSIYRGITAYVSAVLKAGPPPSFQYLHGQFAHSTPLDHIQWKWESKKAEDMLNAAGTAREVIL